MFKSSSFISFAILAASMVPAQAEITRSELPGPESLTAVMSPGTPSTQTVTIVGDRMFPPNVYARMIDTVEFRNHMDTPRTVSDPNGLWTTGEIAPGTSVQITYVTLRGDAPVTAAPTCESWAISGTRADHCQSHRPMVLDNATASDFPAMIVHMTLAGDIADDLGENGYAIVPGS